MQQDLLATVERSDDGSVRVMAPGVGRWSSIPEPGSLLGPGSGIGLLSRLNFRRRLRLPAGVAGRVVHVEPRHRVVPVEWGQELFRLEPLADGGLAEPGAQAVASAAERQGSYAVLAPTDGVFYNRPAPDAAPFLEPGSRVKRGQPVGLVEVMKTFNQILFDDPEFPDEAEVVELRVEDGAEISVGDVLVLLR